MSRVYHRIHNYISHWNQPDSKSYISVTGYSRVTKLCITRYIVAKLTVTNIATSGGTYQIWNVKHLVSETQIMHLTNIIIIMVEKWKHFQPVKRLCWKYIIHFSYLNESWWHKLQNLYPGSIFLDLVLHNLSFLAHICIHLPFIYSLIYYAFC